MNNNLKDIKVNRLHGIGHYSNKIELLLFLNIFMLMLEPAFLFYKVYFILLMPLVLSIVSLIVFINCTIYLKKLSKWKKIDALVDEISVNHYYFGRSGDKYCPYVCYRYIVDDKEYKSDKFFLEHSYCKDMKKSVIKLLDSVLESGLKIYYNPMQKEDSFVFIKYDKKNQFFLNSLPLFSFLFILEFIIIY